AVARFDQADQRRRGHFAQLPEGTVATLVKPENKATLTKILTYHAVAGKVTASALIGLIEAGNGAATVETLAGETLTARVVDGKVVITDAKGGTATVTTADVMTSNGVIHVTDGVFLPA
ncbi:MAG: fasciclin domain-containing protein, partial [Pseudomonadota bacterium]